ncbi:MAG: hypothetical protein ACLT98_02885 [Eggerthellaceae bacterium]
MMVMDVYSAGEDPIEGVSGQTIVDCVNALGDAGKAAYVPSKDETVEAVLDAVRWAICSLRWGRAISPRSALGLCARSSSARRCTACLLSNMNWAIASKASCSKTNL